MKTAIWKCTKRGSLCTICLNFLIEGVWMIALFLWRNCSRILVSLEPESMAADNPNLVKLCIVMAHTRDSHTCHANFKLLAQTVSKINTIMWLTISTNSKSKTEAIYLKGGCGETKTKSQILIKNHMFNITNLLNQSVVLKTKRANDLFYYSEIWFSFTALPL